MTKIYVVIGTRAQLIKMAPLMALMQKEGIEYEFIHTAQHRETITQLVRDFHIKEPDRTLYSGAESNTKTKFLGWFGAMVLRGFNPKKNFPEKGLVLTHGDTATTAWAAVVGKLAGCKVAHVESGLRWFSLFIGPEEWNRLITFRFSDIYFCQNEWALNNLKKYKGDKINTLMNTLYDSVKIAVNLDVNVELPPGKYVVVSIHRVANIYTSKLEKFFIPLIEKVANLGFYIIFILHPSTRAVLQKNNMRLYKKLANNKKIILKERYPFFEFIKLLKNSEFVMTDGGSNQEELSYSGKPTLLFNKRTSRIEGLGENAVEALYNEEIIMKFIKNYKERERPFKNVEISPCEIIVKYLKNL